MSKPWNLSDLSEATRARNADKLPTAPEVPEPQTRAYMLPLRPMATKNSRQSRGNYTAINPVAKVRLEEARSLLRTQHHGELLSTQYDLELIFYFSNRKSWPDTDNAAQFCMDALKKTVIIDDSPKYLRDVTARPRLSRYKRDVIEIVLREVAE